MDNGTHTAIAPNGGDLSLIDAPADTPRAASFGIVPLRTLAAGGATPTESNIASLLPPDLANDSASDSGSRRSSMQPRVASRQLLQTALDLAQKAVEMDKGNDVAGALAAYRDAVTKLRVVMERVGVDPTDGKRGGKDADEGRTLRGIHDAYMARITLLSAYEGSDAEEATAGIGTLMLETTSINSTPPPAPAPNLHLSSDISPTNGDAGPSNPLRSPVSASALSSRRKKRITSKQSFGLDEEADLSGLDGVDGDEASIQEASSVRGLKTLPPVEASPRTSAESDRPLPPLPASGGGDRTRKMSVAEEAQAGVIANSTTTSNSISRRRHQRGPTGQSMSSISELNASPRGSMIESYEGSTRSRTVSSRTYVNGDASIPPVPPLQPAFRSTLAPPIRLQGNAHLAPRPEPQPTELIHRPFHLLRILCMSMDPSGPGAYLTSAIHIDPAMWKPSNWRQPGSSKSSSQPKLVGQEAKARACEALIGHLEAIRSTAAPLLMGVRDERYGGEGQARLSKHEMEQANRVGGELSTLLDGLDDELDATHKALQSKGVAVGTWKGKTKSSWGSRISARVDKMSRGSDSPERYVDLLGQLFLSAQVVDEHLRCFTGPCTPAYHALPHKTYKQIETRLTRAAQFVGAVIVPFVMDDFRQFMLGYLKGGLKYLED